MKKLTMLIFIFLFTFASLSEMIPSVRLMQIDAYAENSDDEKSQDKTDEEAEKEDKDDKEDKEKTKKDEKKDENKKKDSDEDEDDEKSETIDPILEEEYIIHAKKYIVYDMNYNVNLIAKNSNQRFEPYGFTKLLTAITVIENVKDVKKKVVVPDGILKDYDYSYANVGLKAGEETTYMNLLKLMLMRDAGDCALALSHLTLDSYNEFIKAMNATAKKAGVTSSYFDNPAGFSSSKNYSTLDDICRIIKYSLANEIFCEAASCSVLEIPSEDPKAQPKRYFNRNYYMSNFYSLGYFNENIKHGKEYTVGKENTGLFVNYNNGFTNLICICAESDADDEINYAYEDVNELVTQAKSDFITVSVVQKDEIITEVPLKNGENSDRVLLVAEDAVRTKLSNSYDPLKIHRKISLNEKISAPVKKGEILGNITVTYNGSTVGTANLVAFADVDGSIMNYLLYHFDMIINSGWFKTVLFIAIAVLVGYAYLKHRRKSIK